MGLKFRRGTTAQKSGSLAFGEPYVNTDLGTLQIGGDAGDITLGASGTGSAGVFSAISGSGLDISGSANISGDLTIGGKIQIGDNSSDTVNVVASLSSSLIPSLDNTFDLGSLDKYWRDLYISTGSIKMVSNGVVVSTLSNTANGMALDQGLVASGSIKTYANIIVIGTGSISASNYDGIGNLTTYSASVDSRISSSIANQSGLSQSVYETLFYPVTGLSASAATALSASIDILSGSVYNAVQWGPNSLSASVAIALSASIAELSASVSNSLFYPVTGLSASLSSSIHNTIYGNGPFDSGFSGSVSSSISQLSASVSQSIYENIWGPISISSSVATATANSISTLSGSIASEGYAKLNASNIFTGTQVVTGSMYISGDFVVQGSSSLQNITASAVSIGTNTVILNTDSPSVRFGGISVIDQGSSSTTGSLLWDSTNNVWVYQNPEGEGYASAKLISGPKNSGSLGSEVGLTVGQVPVAVGDDHIGNSIISASATQVYVSGSLKIVDATSELQIVGNGFGQASLISPNGALVLTPGLYGVQVNGAYPDLSVNGTISGSITGIGNVTTYSTSVDSRIVTNVNSAAGAFASASAYSASVKLVTDTLAVSASVAASISGSNSTLIAVSASQFTRDANQDSTLTSVSSSLNVVSQSVYSTNITYSVGWSNMTTVSASAWGAFQSASAYSASTATSISILSGRVTTLEGKDISITLTGDVTGTGTITDLANVSFATTIAANSVALGTDTTGDYVATMTAGTGITVGTATGEGSTPVITNTGVTSITGTTSQVIASAGTGGVTLSLPQSIATTSAVAFASVSATGDIVAYSGSDKRLKNNIVNISNALNKVKQLNGVTWKWNDDVNEVTKTAPTTGLIAQEVLEVLPEVVNEREDGYLGIDYSKMVGLLVEAIKEQQTQIAELKAEVEALKK